MNEIVMFMLSGVCVVAFSVLLYSCDDKIDVQQEYDFSLTSWHLQSEIKNGEVVEIRLTLNRSGDYAGAEYYVGYIQMSGKGEVYDKANTLLVNRELHELKAMAGLDTGNPRKQVFTLFYRSMTDKKSEVKFVIVDNAGQERELLISFDADTSTDK